LEFDQFEISSASMAADVSTRVAMGVAFEAADDIDHN
jgi:hypothetical protein